jgi:hypothetical protein
MFFKNTILSIAVFALAAGSVYAGQPVNHTDRNVDFYGYATNFALEPGDEVTAYTAAGVLCGQCTVRQSGSYGFLHVYGDEPSTLQVEGAKPGDSIMLKVNGVPVSPAGPDQPVWTRDGDKHHVDLAR